MEQWGESRPQPAGVESGSPVPHWSGPSLRGRDWLKHFRAQALHRFRDVRYAGAVVGLLFGLLIALVNYNAAESPVPFTAWGWDFICAVVITLLWLWGGWRPFLWLRECYRAHVRDVLYETRLLAQVLSLERSEEQPALWRLVLGPAESQHQDRPRSFQRNIQVFIKHYAKFARQAGRESYPECMMRASIVIIGLGNCIIWLVAVVLQRLMFSPPMGVELPPRIYIALFAVLVSCILAIQAFLEQRRAAVELAVTDVLLGE